MANLPNKSFVFNFNAKNYNPSTFTIPNEEGATMDRDMVWTAMTNTIRSQIEYYDDHLYIPTSAFSFFEFSTSGANPVNITNDTRNLTIVAKWKNGTQSGDVISNRCYNNGSYNWMVRASSVISFHTSTNNGAVPSAVTMTSSVTTTAVIRVSNRQVSIKNLTDNVSNTPFTPNYQTGSHILCFFAGFANQDTHPNEFRNGDFYWAYVSREVLTDEEIQQVVDFNESTFGPDEDSADVPVSGGSVSVNLSAEGVSWTASTASNWITISPTTGTGDSTVTLTVKANNFSERTGTVTFTSGAGDEAEFTVSQGGTDGIVPYKKIYRNNRRIN